MSDSEDIAATESRELVAYRLGRLEKAVEAIHDNSVARDEQILDKLAKVSELSESVQRNTWRIGSLETSRNNMNKAMTALGLTVAAILLEVLFNVIKIG